MPLKIAIPLWLFLGFSPREDPIFGVVICSSLDSIQPIKKGLNMDFWVSLAIVVRDVGELKA